MHSVKTVTEISFPFVQLSRKLWGFTKQVYWKYNLHVIIFHNIYLKQFRSCKYLACQIALRNTKFPLLRLCYWVELSLSYGWRSVNQFVFLSGSPLRPMTRFYLYCTSCRAPSLRRGQICNLQCNRWLVRSLKTSNHTLPSHLRLCSLFVASYDSQGLRWWYSNQLLQGYSKQYIWFQFVPHRKHNTSPFYILTRLHTGSLCYCCGIFEYFKNLHDIKFYAQVRSFTRT
jgi:hypothetical protein